MLRVPSPRLAAFLTCMAVAGCATSTTKLDSGLWHFNAGLYGEAIPRLLSAVPDVERTNPTDPRLPTAYVALGDMAAADREDKKAEEFYNKALALAKTKHPENTTLNRNALVHAGNFLLDQKRPTEALPLLLSAAAISERETSIPRLLYAIDLDNLSLAYDGAKDNVRGDEASSHALEIMSGLNQTNEVVAAKAVVLYNAARRLAEIGRNAEAEAYYRQALANVAANGEQWRKNVVLSNYAQFLKKAGRADEAKGLEDQVKK
jgi:tetratricopeptide (TPR) repeat protein